MIKIRRVYVIVIVLLGVLFAISCPAASTTEAAGHFDGAKYPDTYQVLEGNGWWVNPPKSTAYGMPKGSEPFTFYVRALTDVQMMIELCQQGYYISATTSHDIWTAPSDGVGTCHAEKPIDHNTVLRQGEEYSFEVVRTDHAEGTDYTITVKNVLIGEIFDIFTVKNTIMTGAPDVYLMAQVGKFELYFEGQIYLNHGVNRSRRVSLSDVNNTPPKDYKIPEGLSCSAKEKAYEKYFLKEGIQTVSVQLDADNLDYILQNAGKKPSVMTQQRSFRKFSRGTGRFSCLATERILIPKKLM